MGFDALAQFVDVSIDVFELGDLNNLIDRLLDRWPRVIRELSSIDGLAGERHMSDQIERRFLAVDMDVIVDLIGHFRHLGASRDTLIADEQFGAVDINHFVDPRRTAAKKTLHD